MIIGIIGAMKVEADKLAESMSGKKSEVVSGIEFVSGEIAGIKVVAAVSGVGKVFAALCAQTMILRYGVEMMVNIGVAGTLTKELGVLDVAIADSVLQHDMDTSAVGDPVGMVSGINIINIPADAAMSALLKKCVEKQGRRCMLGPIASGDRFIIGDEAKKAITDRFEAIACEMEGAAIGQTCYVNKVPFAVLRTISDGDGGGMEYEQFKPLAADISISAVLDFLKSPEFKALSN